MTVFFVVDLEFYVGSDRLSAISSTCFADSYMLTSRSGHEPYPQERLHYRPGFQEEFHDRD